MFLGHFGRCFWGVLVGVFGIGCRKAADKKGGQMGTTGEGPAAQTKKHGQMGAGICNSRIANLEDLEIRGKLYNFTDV